MPKATKKAITISYRIAKEDEIVKTLEGDMQAKKGDYIITGVNGEIYPCKPDIFLKTYEILPTRAEIRIAQEDALIANWPVRLDLWIRNPNGHDTGCHQMIRELIAVIKKRDRALAKKALADVFNDYGFMPDLAEKEAEKVLQDNNFIL